jgi:hypothetical protein
LRFQSVVGILIMITLSACQPNSVDKRDLLSALKTSTIVSTIESKTPIPSRTIESLPSETSIITPSPTSEIESSESLQDTINRILSMNSKMDWGIPEETIEKWTAYSRGGADLNGAEKSTLSDFVNRWLILDSTLSETKDMNSDGIHVKVIIFQDTLGKESILPYLVRDNDGDNQYFLYARDQSDQIIALIPAPMITGLKQQISLDGENIDYLDPRGRVMLHADAFELPLEEVNVLSEDIMNNTTQKDDPFKVMLITGNHAYAEFPKNVFPRYKVALDGIDSYFYGLDTSLTDKQIVLLNEAFEIFNRSEFLPFKQIFQSNVSVFMLDDLGTASGMNYTGTGVIVIDRIDLFGNRYLLASVLAHEGAHVLQDHIPNGKDQCSGLQQMEIGSMSIPEDFYIWSADQVIEGIESQLLGAYHVSLWMLSKLGYSNLKFLRDAIYTGKINGQSVVIGCN